MGTWRALWSTSVAFSSGLGCQVVQWKLTLKVFRSMKAAKRCRSFPSVCIQISTMPLSVPRVNIVVVGNPPDARPG